ncbi:sterol desaturase family protein [Chitinophaga pendula]|nr:beta-carotene hydroxylase [Chitinophaga sp. MD30]UCJ10268.1 sterol desaturase family protein [Chitinophaga pendula]
MLYLAYLLVSLGVFAFMEVIAWASHRYIMHGFLWSLHRDHHQPHHGTLEKNDWFAVIFSIPCILLFWAGMYYNNNWLNAVAAGILLYGMAYFFVHDIIVHQRIKIFSRSRNKYVRAIRWAHKMHHRHIGATQGESFGFLYVEKKYRNKIKQDDELQRKKTL